MTNQFHMSLLTCAHILFFLQGTTLVAALKDMAGCHTCILTKKRVLFTVGYLKSHKNEKLSLCKK
jgi:hypothetical protein